MSMNSAHLSAILAFSLWGLFPIYWKLFSEVGPWDLFAHRLIWSFITLIGLLLIKKRTHVLRKIWNNPRTRLMLMISGGLISSNWLLYIYAVNTGRILEASMGYFLNPLFNVFMGRIILKEKIRGTQWPAVALAVLAMVLIAVQSDLGHVPWLALLLSSTFALYGLIRKMVHVGSMEGLAFETSVVITPIMAAWAFQDTTPLTVFSQIPLWKIIILSLSGIVTSVPLMLFAYGAKRLKFGTLGFIQYLSPSLKFVCGLLIFHEPLSTERLQAFVLIWTALAWYSVESYFYFKKVGKNYT